MRDSLTVWAALVVVSACGCPRNGEPPTNVAAGDSQDGDSADGAAAADGSDAADDQPAPAPPAPLGATFRFVPQVGHAGPVWAVPLGDGAVLGIDSTGLAGWWIDFASTAPVRQARRRHLGLGGITAVAHAGPAGAPRVALGTAAGMVYAWSPATTGADDALPVRLDEPPTRAVSALAFSPALDRLGVGVVSGTIRVLRTDGGTVWSRDRDHGEPIAALAFSPDGARLAGGCADGVVTIWNAARGTPLASLPHDGPVTSVAWSPDGARLAVGGAMREVRVWAGEPLAEVARRGGFSQAVTRLAYTPDGTGLVAADELGELHVLDAGSLEGPALGDRSYFPCTPGVPQECFPAREGPLRSLTFDADGGLVLGGADGTVRWLAVAEGVRSTSPAAEVVPLSLAATPDGTGLVVGLTDGTLVWLDATDGRERRRVRAHADGVTALAFDARGRLLSTSLDGTVGVWVDGRDEPLQRLPEHLGPVSCLALAADGTRAATGAVDGAILLWELDDAGLRFGANLEGHVSRVLGLAFAPDSAWLWSVGLDRAVQKWNLARRRSAWSRPLELRVAPTRVLAHDGAALTGGADGALRRVGPGRAAAAGAGLCDGPLTDLEPLPGEPDAALAACGDGAVRRLRAAGPRSGDDWSADGEPWRLAHDAAAVLALAPAAGDAWYAAGEAVTALAGEDGAVRWRVWFTRDGSATCAADDGWGSAGDGARLVGYSDGRTVRTVDDPAVPGRGLDAPPATSD
jgi:WD40 repeat protein